LTVFKNTARIHETRNSTVDETRDQDTRENATWD